MVWEPTTTTRTRRIVGGLVLACALAVHMLDSGAVVVKPEICNHVTWTDWEYWEFSCFNW